MKSCTSVSTNKDNYSDMPEYVKYFTEITFTELLEIPYEKPDVEKLLSVMVSADVISEKLIDTPVAKSYEGQVLSGRKLIVEVKLREKVKYVANKQCQSVHSAHYDDVIKSVFVIVPEEIDGVKVSDLIRRRKYSITPYLEDVYAVMRDCRTIYKCVTLLVDVKFF